MNAEDSHRLRRNLFVLAALIVILLSLAGAWSWSPMRQHLSVDHIVASLQALRDQVGPMAAIAGFAVASILAVPLVFLTLVTVISFGPVTGLIYTLAGGLIGSVVSFSIGRWLGKEAVRRLAGERINAISERLGRRGIVAAVAFRLVPIAPFAVINMVAGTSHIRLRDFLVGSTLGMIPGTVAIALFVDRFIAYAREPGPAGLLFVLLTLILIGGGAFLAKNWLAGVNRR